MVRLNNINVLFIILLKYALNNPPDAVSPPFLRGRQQHACVGAARKCAANRCPERSQYPLAAIYVDTESQGQSASYVNVTVSTQSVREGHAALPEEV